VTELHRPTVPRPVRAPLLSPDAAIDQIEGRYRDEPVTIALSNSIELRPSPRLPHPHRQMEPDQRGADEGINLRGLQGLRRREPAGGLQHVADFRDLAGRADGDPGQAAADQVLKAACSASFITTKSEWTKSRIATWSIVLT